MNVLIIDEQPVVLAGLKALLPQYGMSAVTDVDVQQWQECLASCRNVDVILLDIFWKDDCPIQFLNTIQVEGVTTPAVVYTHSTEMEDLHLLLRNGVKGYISKSDTINTLVYALRETIEGNQVISPLLQTEYLEYLNSSQYGEAKLEKLTTIELEILQCVNKHFTNKMTAEQLNLGAKTIENYKYKLQKKLGLQGRGQLSAFAASYKKNIEKLLKRGKTLYKKEGFHSII